MDFFCLDFGEGTTTFNGENLLQEFTLRVHEVLIVMAAQNLERLQHVLYIARQDGCLSCDILDRQVRPLIAQKQFQNAVEPVADVGTVAEET